MSQENVEVVRGIYDEWGRGNLRAGIDHYDPRITFIPVEGRPDARDDVYLGVEGIGEFFRAWLKEWTDFSMTAEDFIEAGDSVVVTQRQRAEGRASGAPAEMAFFAVWTFRGRTVIRIEHFRSREEALEAAGLSG
jgi:ketosteroid isomerase-like protein